MTSRFVRGVGGALVAGAGASLLWGLLFSVLSPPKPRQEPPSVSRPPATPAPLEERFSKLEASLDSLNGRLDFLEATTRRDDPTLAAKFLRADINHVSEQVRRLRGAVLENPRHALQIPLLRQDFNNLKEATSSGIDGVGNDIDRAYDLMKWVVGTLAVGLIGLFVSSLRVSSKSQGDKTQGEETSH
jgi:hypothetical protein